MSEVILVGQISFKIVVLNLCVAIQMIQTNRKKLFCKVVKFQIFGPFGTSPASVGALFEAVGAQQRKRKYELVVRSTLLHLSLQRGPSGKIQGLASLRYICHFMSAVIWDFPDKLRQCQKSF